jgi:hypothetical protein
MAEEVKVESKELGVRVLRLRVELDGVTRERDDLRKQVEDLTSEISKKDEELKISVQAASDAASAQLNTTTEKKGVDGVPGESQAEFSTLQFTIENLTERLRRCTEENDHLHDDLNTQSEQLVLAQEKLQEARVSLSESQSKSLPIEFELGRLRRDKESLSVRCSRLEADARNINSKSMEERQQLSARIYQLESSLQQSLEEVTSGQEKWRLLQVELASSHDRNSTLLGQLKTLELQLEDKKATFLAELDEQKRIADLFKTNFDEQERRANESCATLASSKTRFAEELDNLRTALAEQVTAGQEAVKKAREDAVTETRQVLEREGLQRLSGFARIEEEPVMMAGAFYPDASTSISMSARTSADADAVADALQTRNSEGSRSLSLPVPPPSSSKLPTVLAGLSLGDMWDRMRAAEKTAAVGERQIAELKLELRTAQAARDTLEPALATLKSDYKRVIESHGKNSKRLDAKILECAAAESALGDVHDQLQTAQREEAAQRMVNADLSSQLQHLMRQSMREEFGNTAIDFGASDSGSGSGSGSGSSNDVISTQLVTYSSVEELQRKNMQLLAVVRALSAEQERLQASEASKSGEEREALLAATNELTALRADRKHMEQVRDCLCLPYF